MIPLQSNTAAFASQPALLQIHVFACTLRFSTWITENGGNVSASSASSNNLTIIAAAHYFFYSE